MTRSSSSKPDSPSAFASGERPAGTPFDDLGIAVIRDEPLARHTWLGLGGPARYFCEPVDVEALSRIAARCHAEGLPLRVLGGGSNVLVPSEGFPGMVVRLSGPGFSRVDVDPPRITAGAGAKLVHVVSTAVQAGLTGMETLVGVPGTVGGALVGNAGGHGGEIGERVRSVTVMNADGSVAVRGREALAFQSRWSNLDDSIVLGCTFELEMEDADVLTKRMQKHWILQRAEQPSGTRSVAMMFKDPVGVSAESLIAQAGGRDLHVGEATVSSGHANFVVAGEGCSSDDIRGLVERVRLRVRERLGVELTPQIEVWSSGERRASA
jgi:UDP-N-acetylmuramate dehydrogenase